MRRERPVAKTQPQIIYSCGSAPRNIQSFGACSHDLCPEAGAIRLSTRIKLAVALWVAAEGLAFYLVAELIGYPEALLLGFLTSLFGWTMLKRAGASAAVKLRAFMQGRRVVEADPRRFADETLASIGAIALLVPGFLSDTLGLVLAIPAVRDRIAGWTGRGSAAAFRRSERPRSQAPQTIDLAPDEWQRGDGSRHSASKP